MTKSAGVIVSSKGHHSLMLKIVIMNSGNTVINVFIKKEKNNEARVQSGLAEFQQQHGNLNFTSSAGI